MKGMSFYIKKIILSFLSKVKRKLSVVIFAYASRMTYYLKNYQEKSI